MKLEFSSAEGSRNGWRQSVRGARVAIEDTLKRNPSLRPTLPAVAGETRRALKFALGNLEDHGEADPMTRARIEARTYNLEAEVLSDWLPDGPAAR